MEEKMTKDDTISEVHNESENTVDLPKELEDMLNLEGMPQKEQHMVKRIMGMSMQMGGVISPQMELMKKMTPEHVSDFLDTQKKTMENQFKEKRENKIFLVVVLLLTLAFIIVLIQLLKDKPDIMEKVLFTLGGLITGLFGGYGIGKSKGDE